MPVVLEAIKFNHDPTSATHDAFNIRTNETVFVAPPEWQQGEATSEPEQSRAAYAICETAGHDITIMAKFTRIDPTESMVEIQAIDPTAQNVLGRVQQRPISFAADDTDYECFKLENVQIGKVGVGSSITTWCWQYRLSPQSSWSDFQTTRHRIYTTLQVPQCPWLQNPFDGSNTQLPWSEILEFACDWANGAGTTDEAATRITKEIRNLETKLKLFYWPSPAYYSDPNFDATKFLDLLRGGPGKSYRLNCSDCATAVSTFANVVGCELWQAWMGHRFDTNPVLAIGSRDWRVWTYNYHVVAWQFPCDEDDRLFDATLKVDSDRLPAQEPHPAQQPINVPFGRAGQRLYRFRLAAPPEVQQNPEYPHPFPDGRQQRSIAPNPRSSLKAHPELLEILKEFYRYEEWKTPPAESEKLFLDNWYLPPNLFPGWTSLTKQRFETLDWPLTVQTLWEGPDHKNLLRIDGQVCDNHEGARRFLMEILTQFECPTLERRDGPGDVAFIEPEDGSVVFTRANLVFLVRNAGHGNNSLIETANAIDRETTRNPESETSELQPMNYFSIPALEVSLGNEFSIEVVGKPSSLLRTHKFFTPDGSISVQQHRLVYQPHQVGRQRLAIFAFDEDGHWFRQHMEFEVKN